MCLSTSLMSPFLPHLFFLHTCCCAFMHIPKCRLVDVCSWGLVGFCMLEIASLQLVFTRLCGHMFIAMHACFYVYFCILCAYLYGFCVCARASEGVGPMNRLQQRESRAVEHTWVRGSVGDFHSGCACVEMWGWDQRLSVRVHLCMLADHLFI